MLTTAPSALKLQPRAAEGPTAARAEEGGRRARGERAGLAAVRRGGLEEARSHESSATHPRAAGGERARLLGVEGCHHDRRPWPPATTPAG
ncbi:MAG: hypothetical protein ACLU0O_11620 [Collinsella sp.]